jgi:hypothetical protein
MVSMIAAGVDVCSSNVAVLLTISGPMNHAEEFNSGHKTLTPNTSCLGFAAFPPRFRASISCSEAAGYFSRLPKVLRNPAS